MFASNRGLGYLLSYAAGTLDTTGVFAVLTILMVLGALIHRLVATLERRALAWRR